MKKNGSSRISQQVSSPALLTLWGSRYASFIFLTLAAVLVVFSSLQPNIAEKAYINIAEVSAPLLDVASRPFVHVANTSDDISRLAALQQENHNLLNENRQLREWYLKALALNTEVQSLRKLNNLKIPGGYDFISSRVIADPGNTYVKSMLVPVGEDDGVAARQAVLSEDGLVGRIISAQNSISRILLVSDVNSRVPVLIEGIRQKAVMAGQNTNMPILTHMPKDVRLEPGTRVLTSGHGGYFPLGLPVGRVVERKNGEYGVRLYADLDNLLYVRVVKTTENPNLIEAAHP